MVEKGIVKEGIVVQAAVRHAPVIKVVVVFVAFGPVRLGLPTGPPAVFAPVLVGVLLRARLRLLGARLPIRRVHRLQLGVTAREANGQNAKDEKNAYVARCGGARPINVCHSGTPSAAGGC